MSYTFPLDRPRRLAVPVRRASAEALLLRTGPIAIFFGVHVLLALSLRFSGFLSVFHAAVVLGVGAWWALTGESNLPKVAYVGGYIVGAEVLWRMSGAPLPWEFGKYGISAIFILALVRNLRFRVPLLPVLFFACLLVSIPLTVMGAYSDEIRGLISFYLSGPFALVCCAWFFASTKLTMSQLQRLFVISIAPIVGVATIALFTYLTTAQVEFTGESNRITSGGFAPNQVSAVLGLGAFLALMFILNGRLNKRYLMVMVMLVLASQSAMTFSRAGLYVAIASGATALVYLSRDRDTRIKILFLVGIIFLVTNFIIYPRLDSATKGALTARFAKKDLTGRDGLLRNEIELWRRNPLLGVGPGMGKYHRRALAVGAHTEYTRLLSEHGTFGLLAIGCLLLIAIQNLKRGGTNVSRAVVASSLVWSALFMASAAMRLAAPAFMFALSYVNLARTEQPSRKRQAKRVVRRLFIT